MTDHQHAMRRNVPLVLGHAAFLNMMFVIPVIVPYYREVIGLGFHQFMVGEAAFSATILLMEVPTGWLSDVWSRKSVMILATLVNILGWVMLWRAHSFLTATAAQATIGVSTSLLSGTNSALLYESLLDQGEEERFRALEGLRFAIGLYASGACAILGGLLYHWNREAPIIGTWATSIVALLATLLLKEPTRHRSAVRKHPVADVIETIRFTLRGHADVGAVILFSGLLFAATKMMFWTQQPYFTAVHIPVAYFGMLTATGMLLGGFGGHFGHRLDGRLNDMTVIKGCFAFAAIVCGLCAVFHHALLAPLMVTSSLTFGIASPRVQAMLSREAPPARRATILSTASLVVHIFSIPLLVVVGVLTDKGGVTVTLLALAGFLAVCNALKGRTN